jgi:ankyrin repeat protein
MNIDADCKKALRWAAQNRPEAIQRLLNANPGALNRSGWTALTFAASAGYEMVVRLLLRRGDNPDARAKDGSTPLMCSAWFGHEVVVKLLLDHGNIDVNAKNEAGQTALWYASRNGHDRVVRLLLERDDVDQNSNDGYGRTPRLRLGRDNVKTDIHGDPSTLERPHLRIAENGRNEAVNPNHRRHSGSTPLLLAASNGDEAMVRLILQQGDNPDPRGQNGDTPLICAARNGHEGVVQLLLECPGVDADANNEASQTPLWCAAENGHDGVVRQLLASDDVDPNAKDEDGWTPLMIAADKGHVPVVQLLLQRPDVDLNSKDENGWTALTIAADKGHEPVVKLLLQRPDVDPNSKDANGWTPVMIAAYNGHESGNSQSVDGSLMLEEGGNSLESIMIRLQLDTSGIFIQTTNERTFNEVKHKLAYDFLSELDNKVAGGQIASKTAWGGGVKIIWSKTLKTTAGRANWMMEKVTSQSSEDTSCQSVMYRHIASIELSEKVIDDEGMCTSIFRECD